MDFYLEQDRNGKTGQPGQVKSYDCGYMTDSNVEKEAQEAGYPSAEEYLKNWWNEVSPELPFTWETLGNGYGYHGTDIFTQNEPDGGILHCKEIFGQIMFDVYPPKDMMESTKPTLNEKQLTKIVEKALKKTMNEYYYRPAQNLSYSDGVFEETFWGKLGEEAAEHIMHLIANSEDEGKIYNSINKRRLNALVKSFKDSIGFLLDYVF